MSITNADQQIRVELTKLLFAGFPFVFAASLVVALALVAVQSPVIDGHMLAGWFALWAVAFTGRLTLALAYHRASAESRATRPWLRHFQLGALVGGLAWGAAGVLLFPANSLVHQVFLCVVLAGVAAGAIPSLGAVWTVSVVFVVATLAPMMLYLPFLDSPLSLPIPPLWALFIAALIVASRRLSRSTRENIGLRVEMSTREAALRESEELYRLIFSQAPLGILHFDADGRIVDCNEKLVEIIGSTRNRLIGFNMLSNLSDDNMKAAVHQALKEGSGYYEDTYRSVTADKETPVRVFFNGVRDNLGHITGGVGVVEDFTERKRTEALVQQQAHYDALTELPNRRLLLERLEQALARCRRHGHVGALLFLDLDHFKRINDSLGHAVGDEILRAVARRLSETLREEDTAARLSGDEFVVLLSELGNRREEAMAQAQGFAGRVQHILGAPYEIRGFRLQVTPSIGLALFPRLSATAHDILRHADAAMYRAKAEGRATYRFYLPSMQAEADQRLALESDLRRALERRELSLHFQPLVDRSGAMVGAEALVRWFHPGRGNVAPTEFIPLAEQTGLILSIGEWVLREACLAIAELDGDERGPEAPRIAVNVSPAQFRQADFVQQVRQNLDAAGISGSHLTLELTEGVLIEDLGDATEKMRALKALGVRFAVDDFGRGYSSLTYLKRLPLDVLKVDQDFVRDIAVDANDAAMVDTIITMARHLGLASVAEGVETVEQLDFLMEKGCDVFQGFYFSEPLSQAELAGFIERSAGGPKPESTHVTGP